MRKFILIIATASLAAACQPHHPSDQASEAALKSAGKERARQSAEEDARQAQRQLELVKERTSNSAQPAQPKK